MSSLAPQPTQILSPESEPRFTVGKLLGGALTTAAVLLAALMLLPPLLGYSRYVILSGSMTGTYDTGSIVFDKPVPVSKLKVGDPITYAPPAGLTPHKLVTHRLVSIKRAANGTVVYRTKGDANPAVDPWTFSLHAKDQAVVRFSVPYVGYAISVLSIRDVRMIVIGAPAALVALLLLAGLFRDAAREAREAKGSTPSTSAV